MMCLLLTLSCHLYSDALYAQPGLSQEISIVNQWPNIEKEIARLTRDFLDPEIRVRENRFVVKLTEGRMKYLAEDYRESAMILLDLVETYDKKKKSPIYKDALFYLADSLYHIGNLRTSARFFKEVVTLGQKNALPCALGRLLEVALRLKRPADAQRYQSRAITAVEQFPDPNLFYLLGKYSYHLGRYSEAYELWRRVEPASSIYPQALYYQGVALVRLSRLDDALNIFQLVSRTDIDLLKIQRDKIREKQAQDQSPQSAQCVFRSTQEQLADEKGWEIVIAQSELAIARLHYEVNHLDQSMESYLKIDRDSPLFREAIRESVWVAIKQGEFARALQRLDVQLIDEPNMLNEPSTRILQGQLLSILGRYSDARSLFQELRERLEILKSRTLTPILRKAKGQLAVYFKRQLLSGNTALNLEALVPKAALQFTEGQLSSSASRSLFVELAALKQDIIASKEDIKKLNWVIDGPNQSEIFPQINRGLLKSLELKYQLFDIQKQINDTADHSGDSKEYAALKRAREDAYKMLEGAPRTEIQLNEREAKVERKLMISDLKSYRLHINIRQLHSQLIALDRYLNDTRPDQVRGGLTPQQRKTTLEQVKKELKENEVLTQRALSLSQDINLTQLRIGLFDQAFELEEALKMKLMLALQAESEWLAVHQKIKSDVLEDLSRQHEIIDDFQTRSRALVRENSASLQEQVRKEEEKIMRYEKRLSQLTQQAKLLGGQIVAYTFYRVLEKLNGLILEIDAGLLDIFWSQKKSSSSQVEEERKRRRIHLQVLNRDMVDSLQ